MSKKQKKTSPTLKKSVEKQKFPLWVKLLAGFSGGILGAKIVSSFQYGKMYPDLVEGSILNPKFLLGFDTPFIMSTQTITLALIIGILTIMAIIVYEDSYKKRRHGVEQGSAKWIPTGSSQDYQDPNYFNNQIFTKTELYSLNMRLTGRNRNVILLGRPGVGKSRYYFKPNLLQRAEGSVVVTDPKGELLRDCGYALRQNGYTIKVLNLDEMWQSNHYNPFSYLKYQHRDTNEIVVNLTNEQIKSKKYKLVDADIQQIINSIIKNTNGENQNGSSDPFWDKAEALYLQAIMYYIAYNYPKEKQNLLTVLELMRKSESVNGAEPELDILFDEWQFGKFLLNERGERVCLKVKAQRRFPMGRQSEGSSQEEQEAEIKEKYLATYSEEERRNHIIDDNGYVRLKTWHNEYDIPCKIENDENIGIKQWKHLRSGAQSEKTMATIMLTAAARLAPLNITEVADFMRDDDMELERIGLSEPTPSIPNGTSEGGRIIWFVITKPNEQAFNFIANLFYTQCFQMIDLNAKKNHGSCPSTVDLYMDEWAQLGEIPRFAEMLAYVRGLNCGITVGLQSLDQLKKVYKDSWEGVLDDCDFLLFLGSTSKSTLEYIVTLLGKETISKRSQSRSYGKSGSSSHSDDIIARDLLDIQELRTIGDGKCILMDMKETRGSGYYSDLYDLTQHPRYNFLYEPWKSEDEENRKKEYVHGKELMKIKKEKETLEFYAKYNIDPQKMEIQLQQKIIDGNAIPYSENIMSPEMFYKKNPDLESQLVSHEMTESDA